MNRSFFIILFVAGFLQLHAQTQKIRLVQADIMAYDKRLGADVQRIIGNAVFEHDGAFLYCDSAHLNNANNSMKAYSRVRIKSSDTLNLYGDSIYYSGDTRIAEVFDHVKLIDKETTLTTDKLVFDRNSGIASYLTGGHIVNGRNTLDSRRGYYHTNSKDFFFRENVVLTNPDYKMRGDTLQYNTHSKIAWFRGPTTIKGKETDIYAENGWYNTLSDIAEFNENAMVINGDQTLTGDSLYYERKNGFGQAFRNIMVVDTVQDIIFTGQYALYQKKLGYTLITEKPEALFLENGDTLFMHSDTMRATFDSAQKTRQVFAFHHVKYFRADIQGMADSLVYSASDSTMRMYGLPVLWTDENQLTADSIFISTSRKQIRNLYLYSAAFIISKDTLGSGFNQIKGRNMTGYFENNELRAIKVQGNSETIYWVREDDGTLTGINKASSSNMSLRLKDKKMQQIVYLEKPTAVLYPENDLKIEDRQLKNFKWMADRRPNSRADIFNW